MKTSIRPLPIAVLAIAITFTVLAFILPAKLLIQLADGIAIALSTAVFVVYSNRVFKAFTQFRPDVYDLIITGIAIGWLTNAVDRSWRLVARVLELHWMMDSMYIGAFLSILSFCAALHLMVKRHAVADQEANLKRESFQGAWWIISLTVFAGVILGVGAILLNR